MTQELPAPLTPADCDLRDFPFMPLDVVRLRDSDLAGHDNAEVFRCAVISWCIAWHQQPAGSLPDDDRMLARLFGYGRDLDSWKALRHSLGGLYGWVKCSDGRLYHPIVAEKVHEAIDRRSKNKNRTKAATEARQGKRDVTRDEDRDEDRDDKRDGSVTVHQGQEGQEGQKRHEAQDTRARARDPKVSQIIEAFDAALVEAWGEDRRRPFPVGTDVVHATRWAAMGLQPAELFEFFLVRQRARKDKGRDPIGSLAFLENAVAELTQAPASSAAAPAQVRFLSPAAELAAREDWAAREVMALKARGETVKDFGAFGLVYDHHAQNFRLKPGERPPIPPPQAKTG